MPLTALFVPRLPTAFQAVLDDGTRALFRPLRQGDAPRIAEGYRMLSQAGRLRRFQNPPDQLSVEHLQSLTASDSRDLAAWGAASLDKPDEPGIGLARYLRWPDEPDAAEVAITIADAYQRKGAGMLLHACLHLAAHRQGYDHFYYEVPANNERLIHQLKDLGAETVGQPGEVRRLRLPVYSRPGRIPHDSLSGQRLVKAMRQIAEARPLGEAVG